MNKLVWLLVPALLVMASCRSAKKATDNGTDKTAPVVTVNTPPATTSKDTQKAPAKQDAPSAAKQIAAGTNFTAKVKVRLRRDDKDISTTGTLRMRYDDVIQITLVDPLLGIAEVGRLELSPDNVLVIDRLNKRIAAVNQAEIYPAPLQPFLRALLKFGLATLGDIDRMVAADSEDAYQLALSQIALTDLDILSENIGLLNLCIVHALKNGGKEGLKQMFDALYGESQQTAEMTELYYEQAMPLSFMKESAISHFST